MKTKFLIAAAVCIAITLFTGCDKNNDTYNDFEDTSGGVGQTDETEQDETDETADGQTDETDAEQDQTNNEDKSEVTVMYITINSNKLNVELAENSSVEALIEILEQNDITYTADDYGNFEKVGDIGYTLPQNNEQITTEPGDVILYQGDNICLYYGVNTYSFTRIGKIIGYSTEQLKELLYAGGGEITVTISLK